MRFFYFFAALLLIQFATISTTFAGPEVKFESEVIDYGQIPHNADGSRFFVISNTGDAPLIIITCSGSCGCTVPKCPEEPIAPGASAKIPVKYDTNRIGKFTKTVTVKTNDEKNPTKTLTIKGEVLSGEDHDHGDGDHGHKH